VAHDAGETGLHQRAVALGLLEVVRVGHREERAADQLAGVAAE
jgi:hypothetical protein